MTPQDKAETRRLIREEIGLLIGSDRILLQKDIIIRDAKNIAVG